MNTIKGVIAAGVLALSAGAATGQATFDSADVPQPHLAAARAIAAEENSWRHPGLGTCYPDESAPMENSLKNPPAATKLFDNLYYVGDSNLSAMALDTSDGIILFDSMNNQEDVDTYILPGLRKVGLDPARVKILIISHGHGDHYGGSRYLQEKLGVKVYMTQVDYDYAARLAAGSAAKHSELAKTAQWIADGGTIRLGDETVTAYITPGHTPAALTMLFPVKDHGQTRTLVYFGGAGTIYQSPELHAAFDKSWRRLVPIVTAAKADGFVSNHARYSDAVYKLEYLHAHPNNPNPFLVGTADTVRFIRELVECNLNMVDIQKVKPANWRYAPRPDRQ